MATRARIIALLALVAVSLTPWAARSQGASFRFAPPDALQAAGGSYTVRWESPPLVIDPGLTSVTWYYSSRADGSDRKRMVTLMKEDFSRGFRLRWQVQGPFVFDWGVFEEPQRVSKRSFLRAPKTGGDAQAVYNEPLPRSDVVLSALVRPTGIRTGFGMRLRLQPNGNCYEIKSKDLALVLSGGGVALREWRLPGTFTGQWYWYEMGVKTWKKEVETRIRVYDEKHQKVLLSCSFPNRPNNAELLRGGFLSLLPQADYAEVYLDPWESRWIDGSTRKFRWDTSEVSPGRYYLVAEITADNREPHLEVSDYQVEVRNVDPVVGN